MKVRRHSTGVLAKQERFSVVKFIAQSLSLTSYFIMLFASLYVIVLFALTPSTEGRRIEIEADGGV